MQGRDLFGVLIRAGGVFLIGRGIFDLVHLIGRLLDIDRGGSQHSAPAFAFGMAAYVIAGLLLLFCADRIVACAYRGGKPGTSSSGEAGNG
jgi:hypothetical protein